MPAGRFLGACLAVVYPTWGRLLRRAESHLPLCSRLAFRREAARRGVSMALPPNGYSISSKL